MLDIAVQEEKTLFMRKAHRLSIALLAIGFATLMPISHGADDPNHHMILDSFGQLGTGESEIYALPESQVQKIIKNIPSDSLANRQYCDSLTDGVCSQKTGLSLRIYLPVCSADVSSLCIEGLSMSGAQSSSLITARYIESTKGRTYSAIASRGIPEASTPSRWQVPGIKNLSGSETYFVKVLLDGFISSTTNKLYIFDINAIVQGYINDGVNDQLAQISEDQRISLTLHLPNTVSGWINGRLKSPSILISKLDANENRVTVEANPVLVPEVDVTLTAQEVSALPDPSFFNTPNGSWSSTNAGSGSGIDWIKQLSGVMKDTASGEHTSWFFSTIGANAINSSNPCLEDKTRLVGLVTTNAAAYSPGAPEFLNGILNYRVAGLHLRPDASSLSIGTYDLLIRSDVARCLYNFTNAPVSATVSVSYENSNKQIGTTIVNEKDGWLHLGAYGFTFSQPTVKIKLKGTVAKTSSITCTKGKSTKKITAAKPVCPKGWVKK